MAAERLPRNVLVDARLVRQEVGVDSEGDGDGAAGDHVGLDRGDRVEGVAGRRLGLVLRPRRRVSRLGAAGTLLDGARGRRVLGRRAVGVLAGLVVRAKGELVREAAVARLDRVIVAASDQPVRLGVVPRVLEEAAVAAARGAALGGVAARAHVLCSEEQQQGWAWEGGESLCVCVSGDGSRRRTRTQGQGRPRITTTTTTHGETAAWRSRAQCRHGH